MHPTIRRAAAELETQFGSLNAMLEGRLRTHRGPVDTTHASIAEAKRRIRELLAMVMTPERA
ncbi:MAG: hypothetical protein JNJ73_05295 [Hyphomonadaceae bacterium]|nr:hypothetical protein [Hyphomonadaceae bacterium]